MLDAVQRLMNDKRPVIDREGNERAAFTFRVAQCYRGLHGIPPAIYGNRCGDRAEWRDTQTCGSVWHCPICAGKVSSKRRDELSAMLAAWRSTDNGAIFLLTYTHSHEKNEMPLAGQLQLMQRCYKSLTGSKRFRALMAEAGNVGSARALEVTHGEYHGWHPHIHALAFLSRDAVVLDRNEKIVLWLSPLARARRLWVERLIDAGLSGIRPGDTGRARFVKLRHLMRCALDIRDGQYAADYVAKYGVEPSTATGGRWGIGSEMTKGHTKRGERLQGRTPFALLLMYSRGNPFAGDLFREYALAFNGKRQLVASPGLRKRLIESLEKNLNLDMFTRVRLLAVLRKEKTDDEIAAASDARCDQKIIRPTFADWRLVLMHKARGEVIVATIEGGAAGARRYLDALAGRPAPPFADVLAQYDDTAIFARPLRFDQIGRAA